MTAFMGMRGTGDWATDQRPKNWRETILYLYPNGTAPLTALMSKMGSQSVDDPQFHWWTKMLQTQGGTVSGIYPSNSLATASTTSHSEGTTVYAKVAATVAGQFREGHQAMLRQTGDYSKDTVGKVVAVSQNGASSYIGIKLLQASQYSDASNIDYVLVIGNINAEGATMPDAMAYDPVKWYNFTQIFRNSLSMTRTAQKTRLRTGDAYREAKREALELHSIEQEKSMMFGIPTENIGDNNQPERTTLGLIPAIKGGYTGHGGPAGTVDSFTTTFAGSTWLDKGEDWLDSQLEAIFRYGDTEKLAFAGSGALLGINKLVKNFGNFEYTAATTDYGIKIVQWTTPFGVINLKLHPLMANDPTMRNSLVIFEPRNLKFRYIDDTQFYSEDEKQNTGAGRKDARDEEYLTEAGMEYHHPVGWGFLNGVGIDG